MESNRPRTPFRNAALASLLSASMMSGCASGYRAADVHHIPLEAKPKLACSIELVEFSNATDARTHIGPDGSTLDLSAIMDRIREQIDEWQSNMEDPESTLELSLQLVRAYPEVKPTQVFFRTVLIADDSHSARRIFRGSHDVYLWTNSEGEHMRAAQGSINQVLDKLHGWLSERCAKT